MKNVLKIILVLLIMMVYTVYKMQKIHNNTEMISKALKRAECQKTVDVNKNQSTKIEIKSK